MIRQSSSLFQHVYPPGVLILISNMKYTPPARQISNYVGVHWGDGCLYIRHHNQMESVIKVYLHMNGTKHVLHQNNACYRLTLFNLNCAKPHCYSSRILHSACTAKVSVWQQSSLSQSCINNLRNLWSLLPVNVLIYYIVFSLSLRYFETKNILSNKCEQGS